MLGISTLSTTNRFSKRAAADDDSLRKSSLPIATPGRLHVARHVLQRRGALEDRAGSPGSRSSSPPRAPGRGAVGDGLRKSATRGSVISTVPAVPARTSTGSLVNGRPSSGRISRRYAPARSSPIRKAPRASLVAHDAVSRAHTRTPSAGWPAAFTTTPLMAPTPVVSCAATDAADERRHDGGRENTLTRMNADGATGRGMVMGVTHHPSADADELLLVRVVVAEDQSPRADECGVTRGAASARPQLDLLREIADDRAKFALLRFVRRGRGQAQHQHLCAGRPHAVDNFARRKIGTEIRDAQAAAGGEHRRAQRADLVALAGQGRKEQPGRRLRARVQPEERAEDVPHRRGHQVFMRDAGRPAVPVVADLRQHRHQHVPEQFERRQDRREPADLLVDGGGIVFLQRGGERGGVERCPSRGIDRRTAALAPAVAARRRSSASVSPARRPMLCPCSTAPRNRRRRAMSASVYIRPRSSRIGVTAPWRRSHARSVSIADPGQLGDRADRVVRRRVAWSSSPAHDPNGRRAGG